MMPTLSLPFLGEKFLEAEEPCTTANNLHQIPQKNPNLQFFSSGTPRCSRQLLLLMVTFEDFQAKGWSFLQRVRTWIIARNGYFRCLRYPEREGGWIPPYYHPSKRYHNRWRRRRRWRIWYDKGWNSKCLEIRWGICILLSRKFKIWYDLDSDTFAMYDPI